MRNLVDNLIRSASPKDKLNILYFPYDGVFEQALPANHEYYCMSEYQFNRSSSRIYGPNFHFVGRKHLFERVPVDLVVFNHRNTQIDIAKSFANALHVPALMFDHEIPAQSSSPKLRKYVFDQCEKTGICFDPFVSNEWGCEIEMPFNYGCSFLGYNEIMIEVKQNNVCFAGDHSREDLNVALRIIDSIEDIAPIGDNFQTTPSYKSFQDILTMFSMSKVGVQIFKECSAPTLLGYQMSFGCVPVVNKTPWTSYWLKDFPELLFETGDQANGIVQSLIQDDDRRMEIAKACLEISSRFNPAIFQLMMNELFIKKAKEVYIR